jgi:hypothetical protein
MLRRLGDATVDGDLRYAPLLLTRGLTRLPLRY